MRSRRPSGAPLRQHCRPSLEGLESRDLPSAMPMMVPGGSSDLTPYLANATKAVAQAANTATVHISAGRLSAKTDQALIQSFANQLYGPVTAPNGTVYTNVPQPTAAEIKRETYVSEFTATYAIGTPRTADRGPTIRLYSNGNDAGSNQYLHGRAQLLILPPSDPTASPSPANPIAGMVVGLGALFPNNYVNSGGNLLLDLTNEPGVAANDPPALSHGLPSRLQWTLDQAGTGVYTSPTYMFNTFVGNGTPGLAPGGSGGAVAWQSGMGEIALSYQPDSHPKAGTLGSGKVVVKIVGLFNNPGDLNPINAIMNQ